MTLPMRPHIRVAVRRHDAGRSVRGERMIATEVPVALTYQGMSHVVMMATPEDLEDFGLGFSLSEGIIQRADELYRISAVPGDQGIVLRITIADEHFQAVFDQHRHLPGRTGCGLCGVETLQQALPELEPIAGKPWQLEPYTLYQAFEALHDRQPEKKATGAVHAAAWCCRDGHIRLVREDVGRHNALDKLIGAMARLRIDFGDGFCLITSRCSYEMVQKAVRMGMPLLAAISAPTSLAVDIAQRHGLTLAALVRDQTFSVFTHPHRMVEHSRVEQISA
mgnify:CR=1 FL=1